MPWNNPDRHRFTDYYIVGHAPTSSGVYGLVSAEQRVYIGETSTIQASLLQHLDGDDKCVTRRRPTGFVFEPCPPHLPPPPHPGLGKPPPRQPP